MRLSAKLKQSYEELLVCKGEEYFYRYILGTAVIAKASISDVENSLLDTAEAFFSTARQTGNENFFVIGRVLRKAAHKLYRESLKSSGKITGGNKRFLQLVG